jgi:hypothetical protein
LNKEVKLQYKKEEEMNSPNLNLVFFFILIPAKQTNKHLGYVKMFAFTIGKVILYFHNLMNEFSKNSKTPLK